MGFFDKMKLSVGIGGAKVELQLHTNPAPRGGLARGTVYLRGGKAEQTCNGIELILKRTRKVRVETEEGDMKMEERTEDLQTQKLTYDGYDLTIHPGSEHSYDFSIRMPSEELPSARYSLTASADIPKAIDPSSTVEVALSDAAPATVADIPQLLDSAEDFENSDQSAQAEATWKQVLALDPKNAQALRRLAETSRTDMERARYFRAYLEVEPTDADKWASFAQNADDRGALDEALGAITRSLELAPSQSFHWNIKSRILDKLGRFDEALAATNQAIATNRDDSYYPYRLKAELLKKNGRTEDALQALVQAMEKGNRWNLSSVLEELPHYGGSHLEDQLCRHALEKNPDQAWFIYNVKGERLLGAGKAKDAITYFTKALEFNTLTEPSERADILVNVGKSHLQLGDKTQATALYQQALGVYPDSYSAKNALEER